MKVLPMKIVLSSKGYNSIDFTGILNLLIFHDIGVLYRCFLYLQLCMMYLGAKIGYFSENIMKMKEDM